MNSICFKQACCIFYCVEYNDMNAKKYTDRVKKMEDIQICYRKDPNEPRLVCNARVFGAPSLYKLYKCKEDIEKACEEDNINDISFGESESNLVAEEEILISNKIENELLNPTWSQMGPLSCTSREVSSKQKLRNRDSTPQLARVLYQQSYSVYLISRHKKQGSLSPSSN